MRLTQICKRQFTYSFVNVKRNRKRIYFRIKEVNGTVKIQLRYAANGLNVFLHITITKKSPHLYETAWPFLSLTLSHFHFFVHSFIYLFARLFIVGHNGDVQPTDKQY